MASASKSRLWLVGLVGAVCLPFSACSSTFTDMPSQTGSIPAGTPEPAAAPAGYPAVHDMPPPRSDVALTKDEQKKAEAELAAARDRQNKRITEADKAR